MLTIRPGYASEILVLQNNYNNSVMANHCFNTLTIHGNIPSIYPHLIDENNCFCLETLVPLNCDSVYNLWGTKWVESDPIECPNGDTLTFSFTSAWSPPHQWLETFASHFPDVRGCLRFSEPGVGAYGDLKFDNGEVTETPITPLCCLPLPLDITESDLEAYQGYLDTKAIHTHWQFLQRVEQLRKESLPEGQHYFVEGLINDEIFRCPVLALKGEDILQTFYIGHEEVGVTELLQECPQRACLTSEFENNFIEVTKVQLMESGPRHSQIFDLRPYQVVWRAFRAVNTL